MSEERNKLEILKNALGAPYSNGGELLFHCPKCKHHRKKLSINIQKNVFKCWVCNYSGRKISTLLKRYASRQTLSQWQSYEDSVDLSKYDEIFLTGQKKKVDHCSPPTLSLPNGFKPLFGRKSGLTKKALDYLGSRGVSYSDIAKWKMGFCDYGEYSARIIVPSFDHEGNLNYYVARDFSECSYKYKNPNISKDIIFNDLNIDWSRDIVLVEGVFDAIKCDNAIPLLGSTLSENSKLFQKICLKKKQIYLAFDDDAKEKEFKISKKGNKG